MKRTKIICTIGPASESEDTMRKMIKAGMNVARLNFSHGDYIEHSKRIETVRKLSTELKTPVAILLDTKGPEIRCGLFTNKKHLLKEGDTFTFFTDEKEGDEHGCWVSYSELYKHLVKGNLILVNDGLIGMRVNAISGSNIECVIENGGEISNRKSINIPGVSIPMPFLSEKDKNDIAFAAENNVDFIAASFTRHADDINSIKSILKAKGNPSIKVIAKIENHEGINNFDSILEASDGIMVARGDLGVEIPLEQVPIAQRSMIDSTLSTGKIIITATQMLESMINNPRPTRAEANDVSNAVWQGTTAVMLSGESAAGKYPVETVAIMARIAETTEQSIDYWAKFYTNNKAMATGTKAGPALARAACDVAATLKAKAIFVLTKSGYSATTVASFRPACPIIAQTVSEQVKRQLALQWGVTAFYGEECDNLKDTLAKAIDRAISEGHFTQGDLIIIVAGLPVGEDGNTNFLKAHIIGEAFL